MAFSIQTNVNSLVAQENLRVNSNFQSQTIQRLTSGYRINSSADDAAGLAIANKFRSDVAELSQGVRNASDGVSQLQIIDGGMNNIGKMLDRLKTLATQSASDTFTGDRNALNSEYQTLVGEINRQSQSIGLNQGGGFAKNLSVYLGGGTGATASATLTNGTVSVDLSKSTVDAQSLGLQGVQAVNGATYDLGTSSATSVQKILNDRGNGAGATTPVGTTQFSFFGAGFSNNDSGAYAGITIDVNLNGVGDTAGLVNAINSAIQTQANMSTGAASNFKAANISASVVTDSSGNQKLAFTSSNSSFQVEAKDRTSNALMGNFAATTEGTSGATGKQMGTVVDGTNNAAAFATRDFQAAGDQQKITFSGGGLTSPVEITLDGDYSAAEGTMATGINNKLTALGVTGITASANGTGLRFTSTRGAISVVAEKSSGGNDWTGLVNTATQNGTLASTGAKYSDVVANGSYEMGTSTSGSAVAKSFSFTNLGAGTQAVTIAANDASGTAHTKTVSLSFAGGTGTSIGAAVAEINKQLQGSNDATLKQITAVQVNDNGVQKINFVSDESAFTVSLGAGGGGNGIKDIAGSQETTTAALKIGSSSTADITTAAGAKSAVSALTSAVKALGTAQAAVGKGQNQINYAIGLAQSQISNFSAAQAQIRDADVASEAANLTKAQVLQQASIAAMAQANSAPQAVLSLLRG